jgi:hypothetical protein
MSATTATAGATAIRPFHIEVPQEEIDALRRRVQAARWPDKETVSDRAADDYERTRELVAVIRGSDGGRRMYGAGDALPAVYTERFRTQTYNDRIIYPGVWNKIVVVAREDDDQAILNHALIQSRRRYRTWRRS